MRKNKSQIGIAAEKLFKNLHEVQVFRDPITGFSSEVRLSERDEKFYNFLQTDYGFKDKVDEEKPIWVQLK